MIVEVFLWDLQRRQLVSQNPWKKLQTSFRESVIGYRQIVVVALSISMHDIITVLSFLFVIEASSISEFFYPVSKYKLPCFLASVLRVCQIVYSHNVKLSELSITLERDSQVQPPEMSIIPERDLQVKPPEIQVPSAGSV